MKDPEASKIPLKSWLLALAAVAVCGPWPGWDPHAGAVVALCIAFVVLARPKGRSWWVWLAPALALIAFLWPSAEEPKRGQLTSQLDGHCRAMLKTGEELAVEPKLLGFLGAEGEAVDPAYPFGLLDRAVRNRSGRTLYLADDRGQIVAWGGAGQAFPAGVRPLGQRQWGVVWSVGGANLWLREPLLVDGRLVGSLVIADHSSLTGRRIFGMRVARGCALELGISSEAMLIRASNSPGVEIPVRVHTDRGSAVSSVWLVGWLLLAAMALVFEPRVAWLVVAVGSGWLYSSGQPLPGVVAALAVMLGGAAIGRIAGVLAPYLARSLVVASVVGAAVAAVFGVPPQRFDWLPEHLLRPSWGGVWMVALAFLFAGWPGVSRDTFSLARRLLAAAFLAALSLGLAAIRVPVDLERLETPGPGVVLPRDGFRADRVLPVALSDCRLEDLAPVLAQRWRLDEWRTPSELRLLDEEGFEISRWGDLSPAGSNVRVARQWEFDDSARYPLELIVATEPWSFLRDWRPGVPLETTQSGRSWFAVMTRSGEVAASLHPDIRGLDAMTAGELFHAGGGWARVEVGDQRRLARVWRQNEWLVAAVSHHASPSDWVVRAAIGFLWFLLGTALVLPPRIRRGQLSTFGGRLRLLIAGGVVIPLAILTLFLHLRIRTQEVRLEENRSLEALQAARYTAVHLGGGFEVDDELARWLAAGWGGEVALWNGIDLLAASRPDFVYTGDLPQLPLAEAFPAYLTGRYDPMVLRWRDRVVATGPVDLQGLRLLIHLYRSDPVRTGSDLGAVDWLLTGALLSALFALVLTTRVEGRLSSSLRQLVAQSRRLLDGEPVGPLQRPKETDLAEVLDAVRSMNETVQQREHSLRHQEELLRITLKTLEQAVVVLEPDGTERFANPAALELENEFGGLFLERLHEAVEEASIGGTASKTVQPVPGRDLTWSIGVAGVPFPDGARGLVAVVDDVTDLVRADRVRQLNQLARIVAHEVKNPLTPVRLWVQELQTAMNRGDPELESLLDEACREISTQVDRLQETANSFSNLVALERWEPEPVDLDEIIADTLAGLGVLERRGIRIGSTSEAAVPPVVMGDRQWIRRAVSNLVQNSLDALAGEPGGVEVTVRSSGEFVTLIVEDTGGGVPDERLSELFSPHFSTTTAGSGLGLALVHQVVIRCHGRVSAANGERGLKVRLEFPSTSVDEPGPTNSQAG